MPAKKPINFTVSDNGCFICTSHYLDKDGYALARLNGVKRHVHRFVYEECFGEITNGLIVRHKCDNPTCINPEHMELGTHEDNAKDRTERNRGAYGSRNGFSKLTEDGVKEIRELKGKITYEEIADKFNISKGHVWAIVQNVSWKHVN